MAFYDLSKEQRSALVADIQSVLVQELELGRLHRTADRFADEDTYIRKAAYLAVGRVYIARPDLKQILLGTLDEYVRHSDFKVRQTVINGAGEIGKVDFESVEHFFDRGLFDTHHSPRNAVIGSIKKMGEVNPDPVLAWAGKYLHHENKEIRREICHGIELRGRKFPQDILPLLKELQFDHTARVRTTLVHVLGQISYKKGCLETVTLHLKTWENQALVREAVKEIIDVHHRYRNFAILSQEEAKSFLAQYGMLDL